MSFINQLSDEVLASRVKDRKEDIRSPYYRDTTAILHSSPFRRLKHKTQVFFAPSNDHICTRIEHVLHVASIATAICRGMHLNDELAWAIGVGHDLGHTPFGHIGEKIISSMMQEKGLGIFEHEINSLRVVDFLTPLNLTYAVRDGIVSHCGEVFVRSLKPDFRVKKLENIKTKKNLMPATWEGCIVRLSDQIAYMGRDFEDAVRLGIVKSTDMPEDVSRFMGTTNGEMINTLVEDIISTSEREGAISFSEPIYEAMSKMIEFNYKNIYRSPMLAGYEKYYSRLIHLIYDYLGNLFESNGFDERKYRNEGNMVAAGFYNYITEKKESYIEFDGNFGRVIFDYISGMSDNFCIDCGNEILKPEHLNQSIESSLTGKWFDAR